LVSPLSTLTRPPHPPARSNRSRATSPPGSAFYKGWRSKAPMALNIFPRRKEAEAAPSEPEITLPEPPAEAAVDTLDGADETRRRTRRGSRGGRGRRRPNGAAETADIADETIEAAAANQPEVEPEPK